jgi:hypothetical protein
MNEQDKPPQLRRAEDEQQQSMELLAIAQWARSGGHGARLGDKLYNPASSAIFITDRSEFRVLSRRPIVAAHDDVRFIYYLTPRRIEQWVSRFAQQQHVLHGNADNESLRQFLVAMTAQEEMKQIQQWYMVVDVSVPTEMFGALQSITSDDWGRHYRLYRVNIPKAMSNLDSSTTETSSK